MDVWLHEGQSPCPPCCLRVNCTDIHLPTHISMTELVVAGHEHWGAQQIREEKAREIFRSEGGGRPRQRRPPQCALSPAFSTHVESSLPFPRFSSWLQVSHGSCLLSELSSDFASLLACSRIRLSLWVRLLSQAKFSKARGAKSVYANVSKDQRLCRSPVPMSVGSIWQTLDAWIDGQVWGTQLKSKNRCLGL